MGAARVSFLRHKPRSIRGRATRLRKRHRFAARPREVIIEQGRTAGHRVAAIRFLWAASRRPALAAISSRLPPSYLTRLAQAKPKGRASPDDRRFPRRCVERRPPRLVRYPDGGVRAYRACRRPFCPPPPQAPHPSPQDTDGLQLASSMDEGWEKCNAGRERGDKFAPVRPAAWRPQCPRSCDFGVNAAQLK